MPDLSTSATLLLKFYLYQNFKISIAVFKILRRKHKFLAASLYFVGPFGALK